MMRVTVELIPGGDESHSRRRILGTMTIQNDGTGTLDVGNYQAVLQAEYTSGAGRTGKVVNFHRRKQSAWSLVGAFLKLWGHTTHSPKDMSK